LGGEDPYFTNVDPTNQQNVFYLSQDLRVFSVSEGESPVPGAPAFTSDPYASIQSFLGYLNSTPAYTTPAAADPLSALPGQASYETADSSITPVNAAHQKNYNFALARVRLRGTALARADNCRVFFRLFVAQSCDTDFQPTTYKSTMGTGADAGRPVFPLASDAGLIDPNGQSLQTIPFFATAAGAHDFDNTVANANIRNVQIPLNQDTVWAYFGCFLDVYDASNNSRFAGTHHCIVAQIAYDDAPIPTSTPAGTVPSPANFDKLAQRNLQITLSENPKSRATHIIPQAFDLRPSNPIATSPGGLLDYPDELMIDWGNTPVGSTASIYWPQVNVSQVLAMANALYSTHLLSAGDANTLQCLVTRGVTYVPIPPALGVNFAGLFTVDLPATVRNGQEFNILLRRISTRRMPIQTPIELKSRPLRAETTDVILGKTDDGPGSKQQNWRYVVGAFQVRIPDTTKETMLRPEEDTLAIMKWRLENMSPLSRWRPVLEKYLTYVAARVDGLGGNSQQIPPSLNGAPDKGAAGKCRMLRNITVILLAALAVTAGALTGAALTVVPLVLAVVLALTAIAWAAQCHPRLCRWLRTFIAGSALGAALLAVLAMLGATAPQLVPVLCVVIILLVVALIAGRMKKCF